MKRIKQHCSPNLVYQVALDVLARPGTCDLVVDKFLLKLTTVRPQFCIYSYCIFYKKLKQMGKISTLSDSQPGVCS